MITSKIKHRIISYLDFLEKKQSHFFIHSPFVFRLSQEVLLNKNKVYPPQELRTLREFLPKNPRTIVYEDFGANASQKGKKHTLSVGEIFKKMAVSAKKGNFLYRLCYFLQPQSLLELGTNLGISTLYQAAALKKQYRFTTIEANESLLFVARQLLRKYPRIRFENSLFDEFLDNLSPDAKFDYVFIDGNHSYEPTLKYVKKLIPHLTPQAVIVLDDIYWSEEMTQAWKELYAWEEFTLTMDLYHFGLLFFRRKQAKEHFVLDFK